MKYNERLRNAWQKSDPYKPIFVAGIWLQSGQLMEMVSDTYFERGRLPVLLDLPSHIGNTREAAIITVAAYGLIGVFSLLQPLVEKSPESFRERSKLTALGGFAVSSAVQVIGETYELTNSIYNPNTGDPADAVYGIGWSVVVAAGIHRLATKTQEQYIAKST